MQQNNLHFTWNGSLHDEKALEKSFRFDDTGREINSEDDFHLVTIRPGFLVYAARIKPGQIPAWDFQVTSAPLCFSFCLSGKMEGHWQRGRRADSVRIERGINSFFWLDQVILLNSLLYLVVGILNSAVLGKIIGGQMAVKIFECGAEITGIGIADKECCLQDGIFACFYHFPCPCHTLLPDIPANGHPHLPAEFFFKIAFIDPHPPGQGRNARWIVPFAAQDIHCLVNRRPDAAGSFHRRDSRGVFQGQHSGQKFQGQGFTMQVVSKGLSSGRHEFSGHAHTFR